MCIRIKSHCWKGKEVWLNLASGQEASWMRIMSSSHRTVGSCWFRWWREASWLLPSWVTRRTKSKIASLARSHNSWRERKKYRWPIMLWWLTCCTPHFNHSKHILMRVKESLLNYSAPMLTLESLNLEIKSWQPFPAPTTQRSKNGEALSSASASQSAKSRQRKCRSTAKQPSASCSTGKTTSTRSSKKMKCSPRQKPSWHKCSDTTAGRRECANEEEPSSLSSVSGSAMFKTLQWTLNTWVGDTSQAIAKFCIVSL